MSIMDEQKTEILNQLKEEVNRERMDEIASEHTHDISNESVFRSMYNDVYGFVLLLTLANISTTAQEGRKHAQLYIKASNVDSGDKHFIITNSTESVVFESREMGLLDRLTMKDTNSPVNGVLVCPVDDSAEWWELFSKEASSMLGKLIMELEDRGFAVTENRLKNNATNHLIDIKWEK